MTRTASSEAQRLARFDDKWTPEPNSGCWLWLGAVNPGGYGVFSAGPSKAKLAHRWNYERRVGEVDDGLDLDHLCRVRSCVNPAHLEPVPRAVNVARGLGAQRTHCKRGHPMSGDNLYVKPDGKRECRICTNRPLRSDVKVCLRGHEQTDANLYVRPNGKAECALCRHERRSANKARNNLSGTF